ncbi:MAG: hypothetical protein AB7K04_06700 [Pseudorhodoplanes sp.]
MTSPVSHITPDPASQNEEEKPLTPEQAQLVTRVRWLMLLSGVATLLGIAVVLGVIGYRVFRSEGSMAQTDVTAMLPKGAKITATALAADRIVVTLDIGGAVEIRTFDLKSLKPSGRLRFATEP